MVEVRYKGRLGNNLFQYCIGRIIAETLGLELRAQPVPGFPRTADVVSGARHQEAGEVLEGHAIDLGAILANRAPRRIVVDGWFQQYRYYRPYRTRIQEWLTFDSQLDSGENPGDRLVVNVRRCDYIQLGWAMPFSYYENAIERLLPPGGSICIVTDDKRDPFFKSFARWRPVFYSGSSLHQMRFMSRARRLVMSQSTFSWWPTFLGQIEHIACPVSVHGGAWSPVAGGESQGVNLLECDRFICVDAGERYQPTKEELRHQVWRLRWRRLVLALNRRGVPIEIPPQ